MECTSTAAHRLLSSCAARHQPGHSQQDQSPPAFPNNKRAYRHRNKIERTFCRLKDERRIATRYDKCAEIFLCAVCLIAAIYFWLN
jgi:transposase